MKAKLTRRNSFVKSIFKDILAFESLLADHKFENNIKRIGAEQELVIVDKNSMKPKPIGPHVIDEKGNREWLVPELSQYNLEINLPPYELVDHCFSKLENTLYDRLNEVVTLLEKYDAHYVLTGILPTIKMSDMSMKYLSPQDRYKQLMKALNSIRMGKKYELRLNGIDELLIHHDSPLLEACNTSFQVHLQISSLDFVKYYNNALALTAPIIAISSNSPLVFGKRLWHESRIALFQQAIDTRSSVNHMRYRSPRVTLGNGFLNKNLLEIYKEDLSKFKIIMDDLKCEDSIDILNSGITPKLKALNLHNSTVYRWNRPCYGISPNGMPHLRIENRVIPSGPTIEDEVSNAAFWIGCLEGMADNVDDIKNYLTWEDVRDNFSKSARMGIDSKFTWYNDKKITVSDLVLKELLPIAEAGLQKNNVSQSDIDKYLGIIKERTEAHMTGARWMLRGYSGLINKISKSEALCAITAEILTNQSKQNNPVHKWKEPTNEQQQSRLTLDISVSEIMDEELFTVSENDSILLVAKLLEFNNLRHVPVEDNKGNFLGIVSSNHLLQVLIKNSLHNNSSSELLVSDVMVKSNIVLRPDDTILKAIQLMKKDGITCLPVVQNKELIGTITEKIFVLITSKLFQQND